MASNSRTELEGGVMGLFVLINTTLLVYKQLSRHNNSNNEQWLKKLFFTTSSNLRLGGG